MAKTEDKSIIPKNNEDSHIFALTAQRKAKKKKMPTVHRDSETILRQLALKEKKRVRKQNAEQSWNNKQNSGAAVSTTRPPGDNPKSIYDYFENCAQKSHGLKKNANYQRRFLNSYTYCYATIEKAKDEEKEECSSMESSIFDFGDESENEPPALTFTVSSEAREKPSHSLSDEESIAEFFKSEYKPRPTNANKENIPNATSTKKNIYLSKTGKGFPPCPPPPPPRRKKNEAESPNQPNKTKKNEPSPTPSQKRKTKKKGTSRKESPVQKEKKQKQKTKPSKQAKPPAAPSSRTQTSPSPSTKKKKSPQAAPPLKKDKQEISEDLSKIEASPPYLQKKSIEEIPNGTPEHNCIEVMVDNDVNAVLASAELCGTTEKCVEDSRAIAERILPLADYQCLPSQGECLDTTAGFVVSTQQCLSKEGCIDPKLICTDMTTSPPECISKSDYLKYQEEILPITNELKANAEKFLEQHCLPRST